MKKTTNTENNPMSQWLMGGNPNAIEAQEAEGQQELINSLQLPLKCNNPRGVNAAAQYHKMGIKTFTASKGDDLFLGVKLPDGWKKEATDHSMWNNLLDDKGRVRATFFYKAAFYDRDAFVNFNHRYIKTQVFVDVKCANNYDKFYCVKDQASGEIIFKTEITKEYSDSNLESQCINFLKTNYPDYEDLNAYWD
jgi:hypothetical protein